MSSSGSIANKDSMTEPNPTLEDLAVDAHARETLSGMANSQIADLLLEIWAETPLHSVTSWVLGEAIERLRGGGSR
jgi:hypothetical protein